MRAEATTQEQAELARVIAAVRAGGRYLPMHRPSSLLSLLDRGMLTAQTDRTRFLGFIPTARGWKVAFDLGLVDPAEDRPVRPSARSPWGQV